MDITSRSSVSSSAVLSFSTLRSGFESPHILPLTHTLTQGQHLVLVGRSGCGKSSLLHVIAGLKAPVSGFVCYQQQCIDHKTLSFWRQQICYIPQQAVMGAETVLEVLLLPWQLKAISSEQKIPHHQQCQEILYRVGLTLSLNQQVNVLSGGERQRLAIARALLMARPIWLMDEPTSALDPQARDQMIALIQQLNIICVSISHDPRWLVKADHIHYMDEE